MARRFYLIQTLVMLEDQEGMESRLRDSLGDIEGAMQSGLYAQLQQSKGDLLKFSGREINPRADLKEDPGCTCRDRGWYGRDHDLKCWMGEVLDAWLEGEKGKDYKEAKED